MRKPTGFSVLAALVLIAGIAAVPAAVDGADGQAAAQQPEDVTVDTGWKDYQRYCQTCHGEWGAGDGTVAKYLKIPPADLTVLSERNDGIFPAERVARVIDGREEVRLHGTRDMPIWGKVLREGSEADPEAAVVRRIAALTATVRWLDGRQTR